MRRCHVCAKVMLFDREFIDPGHSRFLVHDYLGRMHRDFGGIDALVLWQAYPRIGFDSRNQFDHYRLMPGLREAIDELRAAGVKVVLAYNPWDVGTRREPSSDEHTIAGLCAEFGFDAVFLDTLNQGPKALRKALDAAKPGVVLESEMALPITGLTDHHASWAQWFDDSDAPGVMRNRWLERRHMMHCIRRWDLDHTSELHMAWMNGAGMFVWENIFGSWNPWSYRDKSILRSISPIWRRYAELFSEGNWEPLVTTTLPRVFASKWSHNGVELWTLVNRSEETVQGSALPISSDGSNRLFDLIQGKEIDHADIRMWPRWPGAILSLPKSMVNQEFATFLESQQLGFHGGTFDTRRLEPIPARLRSFGVSAPDKELLCRFRARECGEYESAPFSQCAGPRIHYERNFLLRAPIEATQIDDHDVTNAEFEEFMKATGYRPKRGESFLAHWLDHRPPPKLLDSPVVYVDIDDARAYAQWKGCRLPTEAEWQEAMQSAHLTGQKVWNWTESEHFDGHTLFGILKGGYAESITGSDWYADSGPKANDWSAKYIYFHPALDRSEAIGFRCIR